MLVDEGIRIEASIVARDGADADHAQEFLKTLRDNLGDARFAGLKKATLGDRRHHRARSRHGPREKIVLGLLDATP